MKIRFSQTREKIENSDIKYVIFPEDIWIYYNLLKINNEKNPKMKILVKIMKMTNQMISKSRNSHMNTKLTIRGFERDQNCQILPCKLGVIVLESQCPNSD